MIVPMHKLTVLLFHRAKDAFLSRLQELGVVHIALSAQERPAENLSAMQDEIRRLEKFLGAAKKAKGNDVVVSAGTTGEEHAIVEIVRDYELWLQEQEQLLKQQEKDERLLENIAPWGNFDLDSIRRLGESGIRVRFFIAPVKKYAAGDYNALWQEEISRDTTYVYFVVFERGEPLALDCDEFEYPSRDTEALQAELAERRSRLKEQDKTLRRLFGQQARVRAYLTQRQTECEFLRTSSGLVSAVDEKVFVLRGWVPRPQIATVEEFLKREEVYYETARPQPQESVPILLKNNRFARLFEPITRIFDLPRYGEFDLTAFFAPFFMLFYGFCLGDAGYGLIILVLTLALRSRVPARFRPILSLVSFFGVATVIIGVISGSFFGLSTAELTVPQLVWLKNAVLVKQEDLFYVALTLGTIQVLFGMLLKAISRMRQSGFMAGLSTLGWMLFIIGLVRLLLPSIITASPAAWAAPLTYAGMALILLFNDLNANIFLRVGKGLWEIYGVTGVFGDILSYVRLFALGVSGSILGIVINEISWSLRTIPYIGYGLTFVGLVVGHTGNMLLGMLSSFVHPLRLTFVEFYKNAGFEGGGKPYRPFRRIQGA